MKKSAITTLYALVFGLLFGSLAHAAGNNNAITIVYTGNLDGELEPCGCSLEGDFGGIRRQVTMIDRLRKKNPQMFLLSSGGLLRSESPHDRRTGEYILKGVNALKYDAIGVQWADLAYGADFVKNDGLPWVASNGNDTAFEAERRISRNGRTLAFFNWLDPRESPQRQMQASHEMTAARDDSAPLLQALQRAKQQGALTVLATTLKLDEARNLLSLQHVDILLVRSAYEKYGEPRKVDNTLVLQPGSRGMRVGQLDIVLDKSGAIAAWKHLIVPLPRNIPDARRMVAWYQEYNKRVEEDYAKGVQIAKTLQSGNSPYAGAQACQACHAAEHKIWHGSRHSRAYSTLRRVNKAFDSNCIGCHSVGFNQPGGFIDDDTTSHLSNVQCESCHGAAQAHVASGGAQPVTHTAWPREKMCGQCHTPAHSPSFNFDLYWPKIQHKR